MENNAEQKRITIQITGKKIAAFLIVAALWGGSLWFAWRGSEKQQPAVAPEQSNETIQYPLLNPRLQTLSQEERQKMVFPTLIPLRDKLSEFLNDKKDQTAFYVEDLNGGAWCGWNEKEEFIPASLLKVTVAIGAMRKVDNGEWKMDQEFPLEEKEKDPGYGDMWKAQTGTKFTLQSLVEAMLQYSDNTATNIIFQNLSSDERNDVYYHIGLANPETATDENGNNVKMKMLSARNLATIFRALWNATYLTQESSNHLLNVLSDTKFDQSFSEFLAPGSRVAHKIGAFEDPHNAEMKNFHDCGIGFVPNHPYLYCFMTKNLSSSDARSIIAGLNKITYQHFSSAANQNSNK